MNNKAISKTYAVLIITAVVIAVIAGAYYFMNLPPAEETVVTSASLSELGTLDPSTEWSNAMRVLALVYEPLLYYDPLNGETIPALATSWENIENGTIWTFHLRQGVNFRDGTPFNATAVKYSIDRTINLGQGAAYIWDPVEEISVIDDYTVEFKLKYSAPIDIIATSYVSAWIFSPNTPNTAEWFNTGNDCGSGPYEIVTWDSETEAVLEKDEDWWGWKEPNYPMVSSKAPDIFIVKIVKDVVTQETLLRAGDIDIAEYVPLEDVQTLKDDPNLQVLSKPSFTNCWLFFNTKKAPLNSTLVRRAIAHAIKYNDVVDLARSGMGAVSSGPVPKGMPGHYENLTYEYNLEYARQLLADADYPGGGFTLVSTYVAGDYAEQKSLETLKVNLNQLGIDLEIQAMSWEEQYSLAEAGLENPDSAQDIFCMYWWPVYVTPFDFLYLFFEESIYNVAYYSNPDFEAVSYEAYQSEISDVDKAMALYYQAQRIFYDDVPAIPLWDIVQVVPATKRIGNLENAVNPAYPSIIFAQLLSVEK